jgi:predicted alpha-1,2-mannosidase
MVQLSPDTRNDGSWDGCGGYHYDDREILGFSHTHLSGTGCSDYGDILIAPYSQYIDLGKDTAKFTLNHQSEIAKAGYYEVNLKGHARVKLTATERVGIHQYEFAKNGKQFIILDLTHRDEVLDSEVEIIYPNQISGYRHSKAWASNQKVFFDIRFSKPIKNIQFFTEEGQDRKPYHKGKKIKALIEFDASATELIVKCGLSGTNVINAQKNLEAETKGSFDFNKFYTATKQKWDQALAKVNLGDANTKEKNKFYTALYHCILSPCLYSDVNGDYMGRDGKIHNTGGKFNYYTVFSLWDTYRGLHPLINELYPEQAADFIATFLEQYKYGGRLPIWELHSNETNCMIGYHAIPVLWDSYLKGNFKGDPFYALEAMKSIATENKEGIRSYIEYGYVRQDDDHESVSKTLEYAYDDWCIAQMAHSLYNQVSIGDSVRKGKLYEDYYTYLKRSHYWLNVLDPSTGYMRARSNGTLYTPFSPYLVDNNYTEANSFQYSFYAPHHIDQLIACYGGKKGFKQQLDKLFNAKTKTEGRDQADITGLIGQYAHGNEPSHHIAYLYNYTDDSHETQKLIKKIQEELYEDTPDGLCGNEDCGQMSAWYVWSVLGYYPVCPGRPYYDKGINSKNIQIIQGDKKVNIHDYILEKTNAYTLKMPMDTSTDFIPNPYIIEGNLFFTDSQKIEFGCLDKSALIFYSLNDTAHYMYTKPFYIKSNTSIKFYSAWQNRKSPEQKAKFLTLPNDRYVELKSIPNKSYTAGGPNSLVDGLNGTTNWHTGKWQGYQSQDLEALIHFHTPKKSIQTIDISFLEDQRSWIFYPVQVDVFGSKDGKNFENIFSTPIAVPRQDDSNTIRHILVPQKNLTAMKNLKTIKVVAKNYGQLPTWHPGAGGDAFIFIDEIKID